MRTVLTRVAACVAICLVAAAMAVLAPMTTIAAGSNLKSDEPFQKTLIFNTSDIGSTSYRFTVPADRRLVIEYVSGYASNAGGCSLIEEILDTRVSSEAAQHHFVLTKSATSPDGVPLYVFSQDTTIYADPGTTVALNYGVTIGSPCSPFLTATISGRLTTP